MGVLKAIYPRSSCLSHSPTSVFICSITLLLHIPPINSKDTYVRTEQINKNRCFITIDFGCFITSVCNGFQGISVRLSVADHAS